MKRTLTCIICPKGCSMCAQQIQDGIKVTGNSCKRGAEYAISECTAPKRTLTAVMGVANRPGTMVSIKTSAPIAKESMQEAMTTLHRAKAMAPIAIGDVLLEDVFGAQILATKNIL